MTIEAGRQLSHYRLIEKIGEGSMGVVWKALDTVLDREVAIKLLPGGVVADPDRRWLLRPEQAYFTLPEDAVRRLRDVARRSRNFLLRTLREGALPGSIRADIEPELLLVPVLGTIHAVIGAWGAHRLPPSDKPPDPARMLSALARLLEPPLVSSGSGSRPADSHVR